MLRVSPLTFVQFEFDFAFFFFLVAPASEHRAEFPQCLNLGQSVGLLGRVISSSQGLYLYTNTEKRIHIHKH
jgi:hypothetical protein